MTTIEETNNSLEWHRKTAQGIAGAGSGVLSAFAVHPLDTVKARLQIQGFVKKPKYVGILGTMRTIFAEEGIRGLYRGLPANLMALAPTMSVYFSTYEACKQALSAYGGMDKSGVLCQSLSAAGAWTTTCTLTNPLWLVKIRMQTQSFTGQTKYSSSLSALKTIYVKEGVSGLFVGLKASYFGAILVMMQLPLFEQLKIYLSRYPYLQAHPATTALLDQNASVIPLNPLGLMLASSASMATAVLVTYPQELVRSRIQTLKGGVSPVQCFLEVLRTEGYRGLYSGMATNIVRLVPASAMTFTTYELLVRVVDRYFDGKDESR